MLRTARARIVVLQVGVLLLALLVAVVATRTVLVQRLDARIDRALLVDVRELRALATRGVDPATGRPFTDVRSLLRLSLERSVADRDQTQLAIVDGAVTARSAQPPPLRLDRDPAVVAALARPSGELQEVSTEEGTVRFASVAVSLPGGQQGVFVTAAFRDREAREVADVVRVLLLVGLVAALAAAALAAVLAGRVLRPVRLVRRAAAQISESDLSRRIDVDPHGGDDVVEMARTFNGMLDRLEDAFAAQRRFVDDAGHELRTPLTVVRGHLELLPEEPEARQRATALVLDELDRMARIVNDLLLLSKADRPDFVRDEVVDLGRLLDDFEAKAATLADREWQMEARSDRVVRGDGQRLTQALLQLAENAVQHTRDGDDVWFGGAVEDGRVRLWVRDSGPGFLPEERERVFERFARGRDAQRHSPGAGLGLSIVRAVAEGHGGTVHVTGTSTVELLLPARAVA
jgi:signal transduction histidine kinase